MATSLAMQVNHVLYEEIDQIFGTLSASCLPVVVESGGGGFSAADVDIPAFEKCANERETRMRERAGARGQDQEDRCKERMISMFAAKYQKNIPHTTSPPFFYKHPYLQSSISPNQYPISFAEQSPPDYPPFSLPPPPPSPLNQ